MNKLLAALVSVCALAFFALGAGLKGGVTASAEGASAEIVTEVYSGRVLYGNNIDEVKPMASTTKILTAIIVIEDCDLEQIVRVPHEAAMTEGSSVYLKEGEELTVRDLLYGLMLRSGNDCAATLAMAHSGSIKAFAEVMNARAQKIGALNSHFENPSGLPNDNHYTTAHDLALIAAYALKNDTFAQIVSTKYYAERGWKNKNKMLYNYEGANGVKTGYTIKAGRCLVTAAKRDGMWLICVVLNCRDMYGVTAALLDDAFATYSYKRIFGGCADEIPSDVKGKNIAVGTDAEFYYPLREEELSLIRTEKNLPREKALPVAEGEIIGNIKIYFANQLIFSENLCSIIGVDKTYYDILQEIAEGFTP